MTLLQTSLTCAYLALLCAYFFSETSGDFPRRAVNKIALASLYLLLAAIGSARAEFKGLSALLLAGFLLAWLGDVLLLWRFLAGGVSFWLSSLCFSLYALLWLLGRDGTRTLLVVCLPLFLLLSALVAVAAWRRWIDLGRLAPLLVFYLVSVTLTGVLGIGLAGAGRWLLGAGLVLWTVSDYLLIVYKYKSPRHAVLRLNSGLYFSGMLLAALIVFR